MKEYPIHIERVLLGRVRDLIKADKALIVSDENVYPLYGRAFDGFDAYILPPGEKSKSLSELENIYGALYDAKMGRNDPIIALGGGVVGDIAGFAAATYMRGVPLIQVPTTLLAQVDSSVGGKVAVNLPMGKNLAGAFYQPDMVIIDPDTLTTLPTREFSSGMAEVIKYAFITDGPLLGMLENDAPIEDIIRLCCDAKQKVVREDEFDRGGRMVLNFGHTFAHAIEKYGNYETYTHGEAVAAGMMMAMKRSPCASELKDRLANLLKRYNLPLDAPYDPEDLSMDKKGAVFILLEEQGKWIKQSQNFLAEK